MQQLKSCFENGFSAKEFDQRIVSMRPPIPRSFSFVLLFREARIACREFLLVADTSIVLDSRSRLLLRRCRTLVEVMAYRIDMPGIMGRRSSTCLCKQCTMMATKFAMLVGEKKTVRSEVCACHDMKKCVSTLDRSEKGNPKAERNGIKKIYEWRSLLHTPKKHGSKRNQKNNSGTSTGTLCVVFVFLSRGHE